MRKQMEEDRKSVATAVGLSLGGMGPSMSGGKARESCVLRYDPLKLSLEYPKRL